MAKLSKEDISRLEQHGITIGATVTCAFQAQNKIKIKSWDDWELEANGSISSIDAIDDEGCCWLYNETKGTYATVVKPAPSVRKFKQGDIVLRGKHGTIPHKVTGYASDNIVTLTSCDTGKPCQSHQDNIRLRWVRKAEKKRPEPPKPTPSYEVDWTDAPEWATCHTFDKNGSGYWNERIPSALRALWTYHEGFCNKSRFSLPNGLDWKQSLTTRPEPIQTEQPKPEPTIDEQIEAARAELERLEKIKEREQPIELDFLHQYETASIWLSHEKKCLMFKTADIELRTQQHNEYTVLTFHRK